jgi:hypothetical protein
MPCHKKIYMPSSWSELQVSLCPKKRKRKRELAGTTAVGKGAAKGTVDGTKEIGGALGKALRTLERVKNKPDLRRQTRKHPEVILNTLSDCSLIFCADPDTATYFDRLAHR